MCLIGCQHSVVYEVTFPLSPPPVSLSLGGPFVGAERARHAASDDTHGVWQRS